MTPGQEFTVAAIGGLVGCLAAALITAAVLVIVTYVIDRRERPRDLEICRAIDALGTTNRPSKD